MEHCLCYRQNASKCPKLFHRAVVIGIIYINLRLLLYASRKYVLLNSFGYIRMRLRTWKGLAG